MSGATQVKRWGMNQIRPRMTIRTDTDGASVLDVLASGLTSAGFRLHDRNDAGFRAVHSPWLDWITLSPSSRMQMEVRATADGAAIAVTNAGSGTSPSKYAARGLNAAVGEFRRLGISVSWSEWEPEPR